MIVLWGRIVGAKTIIDLFLEKTPKGISLDEVKEHISHIKGVEGVHHIHIWSIDGYNNFATMHVVSNDKNKNIKEEIKEELKEHGIVHSTIEFETVDEHCLEEECALNSKHSHKCHHHHH